MKYLFNMKVIVVSCVQSCDERDAMITRRMYDVVVVVIVNGTVIVAYCRADSAHSH